MSAEETCSMKTTHLWTTLAAGCALAACAAPRTATFATPEEALQRLLDAAEDSDAADELLGPGGFELLRSGDDVADRQDFEAVVELARERVAFEDVDADLKLALLGDEAWELPIPLVREDGTWSFDVEAGREEILNRRVGRNELSTIESLRALVEAQREFAAHSDGGLPGPYAARVLSTPGQHDGLYWPTAEGEPESPLGPFIAEAFAEGYRSGAPVPYHGYFYRLLTAQGPHAPGGSMSYLDDEGRLASGFAVLAWPATWGNSGVMTFSVDRRGIVFERDLGPDTSSAVTRIESFDPDPSWDPVDD
jgi:hypothetical protein